MPVERYATDYLINIEYSSACIEIHKSACYDVIEEPRRKPGLSVAEFARHRGLGNNEANPYSGEFASFMSKEGKYEIRTGEVLM